MWPRRRRSGVLVASASRRGRRPPSPRAVPFSGVRRVTRCGDDWWQWGAGNTESPPARLRGRRGHPEEAAGPPVWFRCGNSRCHVGSERARQTAQDRAAGSPGTAGRLSVSPRGGARGPVRAGNPTSLFAVCRGGARCTEGARRGAEAPGGHAPLRPAPRTADHRGLHVWKPETQRLLNSVNYGSAYGTRIQIFSPQVHHQVKCRNEF